MSVGGITLRCDGVGCGVSLIHAVSTLYQARKDQLEDGWMSIRNADYCRKCWEKLTGPGKKEEKPTVSVRRWCDKHQEFSTNCESCIQELIYEDNAKAGINQAKSPSHSVMSLWKITIRGLGLIESERNPFNWHVAVDFPHSSNEKEAVRLVRKKFTPEWWEEHLIIAVECVGMLHAVGTEVFYERD